MSSDYVLQNFLNKKVYVSDFFMVHLSPCKRALIRSSQRKMDSRVPCLPGYQGISIFVRDLLALLHEKKRNVLPLTRGEHGIVLYVTV